MCIRDRYYVAILFYQDVKIFRSCNIDHVFGNSSLSVIETYILQNLSLIHI